MMLRNLDSESGACNGTRMTVTRLGDHMIECRLLTGQHRGTSVWLPKMRILARETMIPRDIVRTQFPIRLAYAMTINKAQGQTFERVGIYLERPCFAHGQLYVAFSRVRSPDDVRVYVRDGAKQGSFHFRTGNRKFTRNVIYRDFLQEGRQQEEEEEEEEVEPQPQPEREEEETEMETEMEPETEMEVEEEEEECPEPFSIGEDSPPVRRRPNPIPRRTLEELVARVSTQDRPGTTGIGLAKWAFRTTTHHLYDDSDSEEEEEQRQKPQQPQQQKEKETEMETETEVEVEMEVEVETEMVMEEETEMEVEEEEEECPEPFSIGEESPPVRRRPNPIPRRTLDELVARVSTEDRPGTTGIGLAKWAFRTTTHHLYDDDDDSDSEFSPRKTHGL